MFHKLLSKTIITIEFQVARIIYQGIRFHDIRLIMFGVTDIATDVL